MCRIVDLERAVLLVPPRDGRYGKLALELPGQALMIPGHCKPDRNEPDCDERTFTRTVMNQASGMTRALPDIGKLVFDTLNIRQLTSGAIWSEIDIDVYLRFGILVNTPDGLGRGIGRQILKIVPPQYADSVQVILKVWSKNGLNALVEMLQRSVEYDCRGWSCSSVKNQGHNNIFWTMRVERDFIAIRDRMEEYWQLVNGPSSGMQMQRKYTNNWMTGVDFR